MISSKKGLLGSEFVLWFMRFLVIILEVTGITFMVFAVIRMNYDIKDSETVLISKQIMDCLTNNNEIFSSKVDNFPSCINLGDKDSYIRISIFNSTAQIKTTEFGRRDLKVYCEMSGKVKQKYPPSCLQQTYLINFNDSLRQIAYLNISIAYLPEKNV